MGSAWAYDAVSMGLLERGRKVVTYEGDMGDECEFDGAATVNRIDIFFETLALEKPKE